MEDNSARQLINKLDWRALQEFDQLRREREYGGVFQGWEEGAIEFAPTYKYSSSNCNRYSGGIPSKSGEKQRTPAWYGLSLLSYEIISNKEPLCDLKIKYCFCFCINRFIEFYPSSKLIYLPHDPSRYMSYSTTFLEEKDKDEKTSFFLSIHKLDTLINCRCDRILWYGKGVTQLSYFRSESKFSDHRPVSALFSTQVEVEKTINPRMVSPRTILPNITLPKATVSCF